MDFVESAKLWLDSDAENVVAMHCKAGKGRAGIMACILLLRFGECDSAKSAIEMYDKLSLKNSDKKLYFEEIIQKLKTEL